MRNFRFFQGQERPNLLDINFFFPIWTARRFPTPEYLSNIVHGVTNGLLVVFTVDKLLPLIVVFIR